MSDARPLESARTFARLCSLAWRAAPGIASLLVLTHLSLAIVPGAQAWLYKQLVDGVAQGGSPGFPRHELWSAGALYLATLLFAQAAATFMTPLGDQLNERLQGRLRGALLEVGERQTGLAFYDDEAVQNDLETARRGLDYVVLEAMELVPWLLQQLIVVVTLSLLLVRLHPLLPMLLLATALPRLRYENRLQFAIWSGLADRSPHYRWMSYCRRVLAGAEFAKEVRLFGLGGFFLDHYRRTFERAHEELVNLRRQEQRATTFYALLDASVTGGVYVAIVLAAARGRLTIGDVALFSSATFQLSGSLGWLIRSYGALIRHRLTLQALYGVLDRPPRLAVRGGLTPQPPSPPGKGEQDTRRPMSPPFSRAEREPEGVGPRRPPELEFRGVWFSYPGSASPALRGIDLQIAPGEKIAIVGENGAGKTTLLNLIARLYDPSEGEILADGVPLWHLDIREWRQRLSNVSQEFLRLEAPLRTNLTLARLELLDHDDTLRAACAQVGLMDALGALPLGLDQMLGRRFAGGVELSGGEWQKVALARALLREAGEAGYPREVRVIGTEGDSAGGRAPGGVIILDEPTSALDAPTEYAIFQQFVQLAQHRTTILVSHRFSTVRMADRILVLEAGHILEEGTHAALMERGGRYAELFELQAARYR